MEKNIKFRAVVEVLGKPKEHVEKSIKEYLEKLKKNERYEVLTEKFAEIKEQEKEEMWSTFAEIDVKTEKIQDLVSFCFSYMPSMIEILEPNKLIFSETEVSEFLNDMQSKLHQVDMVAKQVKVQNDFLMRNMNGLMKNYITTLLSKGNFDGEQLSKFTGVSRDRLEDFLDQLIDEGKIDLKEGIYYLKKKEA